VLRSPCLHLASRVGVSGRWDPGESGICSRPLLPATILAARIDRLVPGDKRLLQAAAVVGKDVPFALLQAVAEDPEDIVRQSLARLQAAEFLYEARLFPELEFTFKHALTHEVAYAGLLQDRRKMLHATIVDEMERLYADHLDEHVERLAHHALLGEVWDKALAYRSRAGEKAAARAAHRDAAAHFNQGLVAARRLPETSERLEQACELLRMRSAAVFALAELEESWTCLREAETIATRLGDERRLGRIWCALAMYQHWIVGEPVPAIALCERALALPAGGNDIGVQVGARDVIGRSYFLLGEYGRAVAELTKNVTVLAAGFEHERLGWASVPSVMARHFLAFCWAELGDFARGHERATEALRIAEATSNPHAVVGALAGVGYVSSAQGNHARSVQTLERAMSICRESHIAIWIPPVASMLGYAYALAGRLGEVVELPPKGTSDGGAGERCTPCNWARRTSWRVTWIAPERSLIVRSSAVFAVGSAVGRHGDYDSWARLLQRPTRSTPKPPRLIIAKRSGLPSKSACAPSSPTATSASASSTAARTSASKRRSISP
jgi:tetratricopeptide (TPR) repeat protein